MPAQSKSSEMDTKPSVDPEVGKKSIGVDRYTKDLKVLCAGNLVQILHSRVRVLAMLREDDRIDDILAKVCREAHGSGLFEFTQEALKEQVLRGFGGYATASAYATGAKHASVSRPTLVPSPGSNIFATGGNSIEPAKEQSETVTDPLQAADSPETQGSDDSLLRKLRDSIEADISTPWNPDEELPLTAELLADIQKDKYEKSQVTALIESLRNPMPKSMNTLGRTFSPFESGGQTQQTIPASRPRGAPLMIGKVPKGKRRNEKRMAESSSTNLDNMPPEGTSKKTEIEWQQDREKTAVLKDRLKEHTTSETEYQLPALGSSSVDDDVSNSDLFPRRLSAEVPEAHTKHSREVVLLSADKPTPVWLEETKDAHPPAHTSLLSPVTNMKLPSSSRSNMKRPPALSIPISTSSSHRHGAGSVQMMRAMQSSIPKIHSPLRNSFVPDSDSSEDSLPLQLEISPRSKRLVASGTTPNTTNNDARNPTEPTSNHLSDEEMALSQDELDESSELVTQEEIDEVVTRSVRNSLEAQRKRASDHLEDGCS